MLPITLTIVPLPELIQHIISVVLASAPWS